MITTNVSSEGFWNNIVKKMRLIKFISANTLTPPSSPSVQCYLHTSTPHIHTSTSPHLPSPSIHTPHRSPTQRFIHIRLLFFFSLSASKRKNFALFLYFTFTEKSGRGHPSVFRLYFCDLSLFRVTDFYFFHFLTSENSITRFLPVTLIY